MTMPLYPVGLDLTGARVLVIGAGTVAARKVQRLLGHAIALTVIAPVVMPEFELLLTDSKLTLIQRSYHETDLAAYDPLLVFACTDDKALNTTIAEACHAQRRWVNVATDGMAQSSLVVPSVCDFDSLQVALFSQGQSPALLKLLRQQLEAEWGPWVGRYMAGLGVVREQLKATEPDAQKRQDVMKRLSSDPALLTWLQANSEATTEDFAQFALLPSRSQGSVRA